MKGGWSTPEDGATPGGSASGPARSQDPWAGGEWTFHVPGERSQPDGAAAVDDVTGAAPAHPHPGFSRPRDWQLPHATSILTDSPGHPAPDRADAAAGAGGTGYAGDIDGPGEPPQPGSPSVAGPGAAARKKRRRWPFVAIVAGVAVLAGVGGGLLGAELNEPARASNDTVTVIGSDPAKVGERPSNSTAGVASTVLPSVVSIAAADGNGSGFIISDDGYVLTNNHVVAAGTGVDGGSIDIETADGEQYEAEIVGTSPSYDLAVLRIDAEGLQPVVLGDSSSVAVGDPVIAIGSPLGLDSTVTSGIISALDRPVTAGDQSDQSYINALQTDAAINPGNSGGPLVDASGRVVGINSAIATMGLSSDVGSIGLGFAIPIDQARRTAEQLISDGEAVYPIIGVLLDNGHAGSGARVADDNDDQPGVTPDGPADTAGIRSGDIIVELDGRRVRGPGELIVMLRSLEPGDEVTLTVERGDNSREVKVTLGSAVG